MPGGNAIEFWYEFASPYSWMAADRVDALAAGIGRAVDWQPFLLGPIFAAGRADGRPFQPMSEAERAYRRIDIARCCADLGLDWREPSVYPRAGLLAARVALAVKDEGRIADVSRAIYEANFRDDREIADEAVMAGILEERGIDPAPVLARARAPEIKQALRAQGDNALARGVFGAPTLIVDGELFWGNDRLAQAMRRAGA